MTHYGVSTDALLLLSHQEEGQSASPTTVTLNLIGGSFGIGIFSLSWTVAGSSIVSSIFVFAIVVIVNAWTVHVLVRGAEKYDVYDLGSLLSKLHPRISRISQYTVNITNYAVLLIGQINYTTVMAVALKDIMGNSGWSAIASRVTVGAVMLPLCFLNQKYLNVTSGITITLNLFIFGIICYLPKRPTGTCALGIGEGTMSMVASFEQAIVIQMCALPMYQDMKDRSPARFCRSVNTAFLVVFFLFSAYFTLGYLTFGPEVHGLILRSFPDDPFGEMGRIAGGISVVGCYPIFEQAMVAPIWNLKSDMRWPFYVAATVITVGGTTALSIFISDYAILNVISGCICAVVFVCLVPCVVGYSLLELSGFERTGLMVLLVIGTTIGILGFFYSDNYVGGMHCFWQL